MISPNPYGPSAVYDCRSASIGRLVPALKFADNRKDGVLLNKDKITSDVWREWVK